VCGKSFFVKLSDHERGGGRFCSRGCKGQWNSEHMRGENSPAWRGGLVKATCEQCGKEFEVWPYRVGSARFCSFECHHAWAVGPNSPNWQGGLSMEPYPAEFNHRFRELIRMRDQFTCAICGQQTGGATVHHINYVKADVDPANCITLCFECHSRTNFDREHWQRLLAPIAVAREVQRAAKSIVLKEKSDAI
jgi:transcription elongation factor Elf1